jgi:homoserine kinase
MVYTIKKLEFKKLEWRLGCKTCIPGLMLHKNISVNTENSRIMLHKNPSVHTENSRIMLRRQNPYQHQFVNVNNNNYTYCAKMAGKEETPTCRKNNTEISRIMLQKNPSVNTKNSRIMLQKNPSVNTENSRIMLQKNPSVNTENS